MPAPYGKTIHNEASAVTITGTTETVILTLTGINTDNIIPRVRISGSAQITAGTNATLVTLRCRRGTVSGTAVGTAEAGTVTAAGKYVVPFDFCDELEGQAGGVYVITAQQTSATGDGTADAVAASATPF